MKRLLHLRVGAALAALALFFTGPATAGLNAPGGMEMATSVVSGTFTVTGNSTTQVYLGLFNVSLWGTFTGTVILERSFDGGTTYLPLATDTLGTANAYTAPMTIVVNEPEPGAIYRLRCSSLGSGSINYRMAAGPRLT